MREINYAQAIREAHAQLLANDPRVFVIGQGLWSPWYAGTTLKDIDKEFGRDRILDSPVSENAVTGAAVGAALAGMRPIVFHPRTLLSKTGKTPPSRVESRGLSCPESRY
jgi:acetoin:2,6-dichlorophenolindophenol oxidoreductase subunit beta